MGCSVRPSLFNSLLFSLLGSFGKLGLLRAVLGLLRAIDTFCDALFMIGGGLCISWLATLVVGSSGLFGFLTYKPPAAVAASSLEIKHETSRFPPDTLLTYNPVSTHRRLGPNQYKSKAMVGSGPCLNLPPSLARIRQNSEVTPIYDP